MAVGIPFTPDIADFIAILYEKKGVIKSVARHYTVHPETIYDYCYKRPEALKALEDVRTYKKHDFIDLAEHVTFYNLTRYEQNPGLAQRAADKVIDKLGHIRGWQDAKVESPPPNQTNLDKDHIIMTQANEIAELKANANQSKTE